MKTFCSLAVLLALAAPCQAVRANPIEKVLELVSNLQTKVTADGAESKKLYDEFAAWCEDRAANLNFEIKTGESEVAGLSATIGQQTALVASLTSKVEELSSSIATAEADLKAATEIRAKESGDFAAVEKDLVETLDMLKRAISVIERELRKGGSAMLQASRASSLADAMAAVVQASGLNGRDARKLQVLIQQRSEDSDGDGDIGAPEAAVYEGHSGNIIKTLEDLEDQAGSQLEDARKQETANRHSFEKLQQSLEDQVKHETKELNEAQSGISAASETKSAAEGDLDRTSKDLAEDKVSLEDLHHDCFSKAEDFAAETKSRDEELKALASAKQVLEETTGGAAGLSYGLNQLSFLQVRRSGSGSAGFRAMRMVRALARRHHSASLAKLAQRLAAANTGAAAAGADPFAKIKGLISDMIAKLEEEAGADAAHKAFCDKELAENDAKHEEKTGKVEKLTTKIDSLSARSAQLKEEVKALETALAELARAQAEAEQLRQQEHEAFVSAKADLELGIKGVTAALKTLKDYYGQADHAHAASDGAATGIIGLIEVVESDLSKGLAEAEASEQSALINYQQTTKENEISKATKEADVKYKSKESTGLDKTIAETSTDRATLETELAAVDEYLAKLHEQCDAKAEPYEERASRREAEIAGLKDALEVLSGEPALLQKSSVRRSLRGSV